MANLIIKSSADNLVLKGSGQTGSDVAVTVGATGNTTLSGTANNLGTITSATTFPAGHIIQTQFRNFTGQQVIGNGSSGGDTFTTIGSGVSGQEFSIDMAVGSGNKIIGFGNINIGSSVRYTGIRLFADSTQIAQGDAWGSNRQRMTVSTQVDNDAGGLEQHVMWNTSFSFNYTPSSTSTITYTVKAASASEATAISYINRIEADTDGSHVHTGYSSLILMEIKG